MLQLNGHIGSQLEVTFVKGTQGVRAQERVGGREVLIAESKIEVRPGDKCLVTLIRQNAAANVYYCQVDRVTEAGDGQSSLFEKTLTEVEIGCRRSEVNFEQKVISRLRAQCVGGAGDTIMMETLLDVLESYAVASTAHRASITYGHYCIAIARLVNKIHVTDAQARIALYRRAAQYCSTNDEGRNWAEGFTSVANSWAERLSRAAQAAT